VWSVPGWEVDNEHGGLFGEVNPKVTCGDGTYYQLPREELQNHPLNSCKSGGTAIPAVPVVAGDAHSHDEGSDATTASTDDLGLGMLQNGHHDAMTNVTLDEKTQAKLNEQLTVTREVAAMYPTMRDAVAAGYRRAGPFVPGLGVHVIRYNQYAGNFDGTMSHDDLLNPMSIIYESLDPDAKIAGFMYYSFSDKEPEGFVGPNDHWHYHTDVCTVMGPDGETEAPYGADKSVTKKQCDAVGGFLMKKTQWMVHVWTVPGYVQGAEHGGIFAEVNPQLKCADGTYLMVPDEELPNNLLNVCLNKKSE
jgi:hypothetical protein